MATVNHTSVRVDGVSERTRVLSWTPLTSANPDGDFIVVPEHADVTVHVFGTFGAATFFWQGTNEISTTTGVHTLDDTRGSGNGISMLNAGSRQVLNPLLRMRPILTGADGSTSLTVLVCVRRKV